MSMAKQTPQFLMGADGSLGYESGGQQVNLVSAKTNRATGKIELYSGVLVIESFGVENQDQRFVLQNTAGIYRQSGVARAVYDLSYRIPTTTYYVSSEATNGFVVGSDTNSGLSKAAAKLTLSSAFSAASAGDVIIINDSATPYDSVFYNLNKAITILPWTDRGVTLRSTFASYTFQIAASNITLGALIIDTNATGASALRSVSAPCDNLRLIGTKLLAHSTYFLHHMGTVELIGGVDCVSSGASKSLINLPTASAGSVTIGKGTLIDGIVLHNPVVDGVNFTASGARIRGNAAAATVAIQSTGAASYLIEDCDLGVDTSTQGSGILITSSVARECSSVVIRRNTVSHGVAAAQQTGGYGICVGNESTIVENLRNVAIYENDINHGNHGLMIGYGVKSCAVYGNVVRDATIGILSKGNVNATTIYSNIVMGGPLTGGGLRAKETTGAKFYNNLVVFNSQSVAGGVFQYVNTTSAGISYQNNVLYAPGVAVSSAVVVAADSSASFANNDYYAGSFGSIAFNYGPSFYASVAAWRVVEPTAISVDPLFVGNGDYRLMSSSPLIGVGNVLAANDFFGGAIGWHVGPMGSA